MEPHAALSAWWHATGRAPARALRAEHGVRALESQYGLTLPADFRAYLGNAAPAESFWDDQDVVWWPPDRIRNIPDEYEHALHDPAIAGEPETYLFFADFMIWCWAWAICCSEGPNRGRVALIGGEPDHFVADSFAQFVSRYLEKPESVW